MASRLGFRLAAKFARQPALLTQRRVMSSGPAKQSSDMPWIIGATVATVGGLALVYSSSSKPTEHHTKDATQPKKETAKEEDESGEKVSGSEGGSDKGNAPDVGAATDSVKQSIKSDGDPATAKSEEAKPSKRDESKSDSDPDGDFVKIEKMPVPDVKDTLRKEDMDVPAAAKNDEEKAAKKRN